jgi:VWFA-related protein
VRAPVLALAFAAAATALHAAAAPSSPVPIRVDVVAEDREGRTVEKLAAEDFEVLENGTRRDVSSATFVRGTGAVEPGEIARPIESAADEQAEAAKDGTRLFAIFLDEYHITAGDGVAEVRAALDRFIERALGPRDLVLVVKPLDSLLTLRTTRDLEAVRRAIAQVEGRRGIYEPRTALEASITAGNRDRTDAVRVQVAMSALNAIAAHLGRLSIARKSLIVVSEGFAAPPRRRGEGGLPTLDSVIRAANRGAVSISTIDPRAFSPRAGSSPHSAVDAAGSGEQPPDLDALAALAVETNGIAMLTADAVNPGLDRIVRDISGHYLLTLSPLEKPDGGRFHPTYVRVRKPGISARARKGYWSPTPDDLYRASAAARVGTPPPPPPLPRRVSPLIRPWFGLTRDADGGARIRFVWEPADRVPGERGQRPAPARIRFKATGTDGRTIYEGAVRPAGVPLGPPDTPPQLAFTAPPGRIRIEMAIEDATTRVIDTDVRDVVVRTLAGPIVLGTPQVLRSRTAREHGLLGSSPEAAPLATRVFSRTERLWVRIGVYATEGTPRVSARLLNRVGGEMRTLSVETTAVADVYQVDVPLAGLAAGEYSVQFSAASGGRDISEGVTFRVTP